AYRCRGFGKQMMQFALNISREAGCYKMSLSSNVLRIHAHKFYEDLGFQKHGWSFSLTL
ncbi:MAG: GNAT family N-acetyltransferase, partial [Microcoleaceae cyanobacterium]